MDTSPKFKLSELKVNLIATTGLLLLLAAACNERRAAPPGPVLERVPGQGLHTL